MCPSPPARGVRGAQPPQAPTGPGRACGHCHPRPHSGAGPSPSTSAGPRCPLGSGRPCPSPPSGKVPFYPEEKILALVMNCPLLSWNRKPGFPLRSRPPVPIRVAGRRLALCPHLPGPLEPLPDSRPCSLLGGPPFPPCLSRGHSAPPHAATSPSTFLRWLVYSGSQLRRHEGRR